MKRSLYEKETYLSLHPVIFLYGLEPLTSAVLNLWASKSFELTDDFAKQLGFNNGSRQGWLCGILWEISPTQSVSTNLLFVSWFWLPYWQLSISSFIEAGSLTAHYTYMGQILLSQAFSCYNYFAGRPLLASFSTPSLRQRYLASSSIALFTLWLLYPFSSLELFCIKPGVWEKLKLGHNKWEKFEWSSPRG